MKEGFNFLFINISHHTSTVAGGEPYQCFVISLKIGNSCIVFF